MKICVLISSYEGTGEEYAIVPTDYYDPSIWVTGHDFTTKYLTKGNAVEKISEALGEGYDCFWNFLWGLEFYSVAGVEAIRYLESTKYPMIGPSSKYMGLSKVDMKRAGEKCGILTPKWTTASALDLVGLSYPVIVKPSDGYCSVHLSKRSICQNEGEVKEQIRFLLAQKENPCKDVLIEEFILGADYSCMVLETVEGVIALQPIVYEYPKNRAPMDCFLDWESKCAPLIEGVGKEKDLVGYRIISKDDDVSKMVKETSINAFVALGVTGSGYARVDLRVRGHQVFMLEVNNTPAFFCFKGNKYGDDDVILQTFPGGHTALADAILKSKLALLFTGNFYNSHASIYDAVFHPTKNLLVWEEIASKKDFSGSVLDLGCGTGYLGNLIQKTTATPVILTGIDVSQEMGALAKNYAQVHIGLMENVLGELVLKKEKFNHVVGYGVFFFLNNANFEATLRHCFDIAEQSIVLTVEDASEEYIQGVLREGSSAYNNVGILKKFSESKIPEGWKLDFWRRDFGWRSTMCKVDIFAVTVGFRKVGDQDENKEN